MEILSIEPRIACEDESHIVFFGMKRNSINLLAHSVVR